MKLEDFIKAAISFYEHSTHKRATFVKPNPKKNKFEIKCGKFVFDIYYHDRKHEAYIQYVDLDNALTYQCESPRNMANAMTRFPIIVQELKQIKKALIDKGRAFFNSLPKKRGRRFESNETGFSIYDKETTANYISSMSGFIDVSRLHEKNFNTLSTNPVFTWQVYEPDNYDRDAIEEIDLDQAFDNFVAEFTKIYLPVENQSVPVQEAKIKDQIIWHGTSTKFNTFQPKTAWFHLTRNEGIGAALVNNDQRCYLLKCKLNKNVVIATEKQAQKVLNTISKKFGIEDEFMYSMLDPSVGEFDTKFISAFKEALIKAGYSATYMEDESQLDPGGPTFVRSIAVFSPDKDVKILETINGEKLRAEHDRLLGLPNFL